MQHEPQRDSPDADPPHQEGAGLQDADADADADARAGTGGSRASFQRPEAAALDAALLAHRQQPENTELRNMLLVLLYRALSVQAKELTTRQFRPLMHREDELVLRTLARIEARQDGDTSEEAPAQLLPDYAFGPGARSIYNYVLQKTLNIARNMQAEAYVPDGGFRSRDLIARFAALGVGVSEQAGHHGLHSGMQIEVPMAMPGDEDESDAFARAVPEHLRVSETPMRHSFLRVNSLALKLESLAQDMVGKTLPAADGGAESAELRLTVNHQRIWRAWLGLSHPELIDLAEEDLAGALGISKATVTRDTSAAFAYMLQHPDLRTVLLLMEPNRFQSSAAAAKEIEVKMDELENALRGRHGKSFFRKCVHQWLGEHS